MKRVLNATPLLLLVWALGCQDQGADPTAVRPSFAAASAAAACPSHATFVASDEASLEAAVAAAHPHDTIALKGMIDLTVAPEVFVETDGLTFTCATPGSGLSAEPETVSWLFVILSRHVTIQGLTLDAANPVSGAVVAFNGVEGPFTGFAEDVRLIGNHVRCIGQHIEACISIRNDAAGVPGVLISRNTFEAEPTQTTIELIGVSDGHVDANTITGGLGGSADPTDFIAVSGGRFTRNVVQCASVCLFADGSPGLVVAANQFQASVAASGVHLQDGTDGDSVVGNSVIATAPSVVPALGGIRLRDGASAVVADNVVSGPWANSIALTNLTGGDVEQNSLRGAARFGIGVSTGVSLIPISMTGNIFRANRVSGAAVAGVSVQYACRNSFVGNDLQGNAGNVGLVFKDSTGANTFAGDAGLVVDNGAFDCDGDGLNDRNVISGPGMTRYGLRLGGAASVGDPQRAVHGIAIK